MLLQKSLYFLRGDHVCDAKGVEGWGMGDERFIGDGDVGNTDKPGVLSFVAAVSLGQKPWKLSRARKIEFYVHEGFETSSPARIPELLHEKGNPEQLECGSFPRG